MRAIKATEWKKGYPFYRGKNVTDYITKGGFVKGLPSKAVTTKKMLTPKGTKKVEVIRLNWLQNRKNFPTGSVLIAGRDGRVPTRLHPNSKIKEKILPGNFKTNVLKNIYGYENGISLPVVSNANIKDGFYKRGTELKIVTINEKNQQITETTLKLTDKASVIKSIEKLKQQGMILDAMVAVANFVDPLSFLGSYAPFSGLYEQVADRIRFSWELDSYMGAWVVVDEKTVPLKPKMESSQQKRRQKRRQERRKAKRQERKSQRQTKMPGLVLGSIDAGIAGLLLL